MLFHVSEDPTIERFEPRRTEGSEAPAVWAIDAAHLRNYLLPRECPRVTFYAGAQTSAEDIGRLLGVNSAVVAIERAWLDRARECRLYCYHLPADSFECVDEVAGYFVSRVGVTPIHRETVNDPIAELARRGVDVRVLPNLWPLRDDVVTSTLQFSMIRMRNALPRDR